MSKPILDKAEVALEYPEKFYSGTFERTSRFEASFNESGVSLILERQGSADERKSVHIHLHYGLFADVLNQLCESTSDLPEGKLGREQLLRAVARLQRALESVPMRAT
jgi:hypothetical protein